ncbi:hypothetical protein AZE42_04534 [Rhizopogon vesiculosus]|uniref:DUF6533 domain-containing protein n=1 Tax=Rhizopogon vesiculosus TaxID=180088 RepID=A0A1J8QBD9_9AGAM|nr:hypothetical protein AZE42_04534 [Rhizopogon vesiculosus]
MATSISTLPTPFLIAAIDDQQLKAYDWLLTIGSEFTYVWSRRWGIIELLYLFSRYLPFVDTPIMLIYHFYLVDPSIEACHTALTAQCVMYIIGVSISEQIFMIRTWAVWKKNNVVGLVLFIGTAAVFITQLYLTAVYASSLTYFQGYNLGGCFIITSSSKVALLSIGIFLFVQFTYLMLVVVKIYPTVRSERGISLLLNVILQDGKSSDSHGRQLLTITGIFFYIMLFVLILVNIIFLSQPGPISTVLTILTRICHSIFASRIILHIRDVDKHGTNDAFTSTAVRSVIFTDVLCQIEMDDQLNDSDSDSERPSLQA